MSVALGLSTGLNANLIFEAQHFGLLIVVHLFILIHVCPQSTGVASGICIFLFLFEPFSAPNFRVVEKGKDRFVDAGAGLPNPAGPVGKTCQQATELCVLQKNATAGRRTRV